MERDKINELFDYYFGEVIKESCDEVWDAQKDIINFCEFVISKLNMSDVISSDPFKNELEKAIEMGESVGFNEDGGYDYFCNSDALEAVMVVIKKHLLQPIKN